MPHSSVNLESLLNVRWGGRAVEGDAEGESVFQALGTTLALVCVL